MKKILGLCVFISMQISANDSTGYVATGGVQYLKNPKISMQSEDLFISKNIIRVNYQFKNLTAQDITETVLFPLPRVGSSRESDFAHTEQLIQSFKLTIERDPNELVSFCWKGQVKKISSTQFQMTEKNFVPKQDLDIIFVHKF